MILRNISFAMIGLFIMGISFTGCTNDSIAEQENLYQNAKIDLKDIEVIDD